MGDCRFGVSPVNYPDPDNCVVIATEDVILLWPGNFIGGECLV